MNADRNLLVYDDPKVVAEYAAMEELTGAEVYLFEKYIRKDADILDIGVGGGRTTPFLSSAAQTYVGIDYSARMVSACRAKHPELIFFCEDATNLGRFGEATFDAVIFSFNGMDNIRSLGARQSCYQEAWRVLKPRGVFIFSSHNAKCIGLWPSLEGAGRLRNGKRIAKTAYKSLPIARMSIGSGAFWRGHGYVLDPAHGGLVGLLSTPEFVAREADANHFMIEEFVGNEYPKNRCKYFTVWYYYVLRKL